MFFQLVPGGFSDTVIYTKSSAVADFVYTSESTESCEKHSTQRW